MCDWYPNDYEVAINANWLQEQLRELAKANRSISVLKNRIEILETISILNSTIEYRINVKG
jgi:hypothetical protein